MELQKMVGTLENHWDGILGFWQFGEATNAAMEGFNNKIRTLNFDRIFIGSDERFDLEILF